MKRTGSFFSIPGVIFTAIFLAGLGLSVWLNGGRAFSPGALSAQSPSGQPLGGYSSHLEFEKRCRLCHQPLTTTQDQLCLECHQNVAEQIRLDQGTHSKIEQVNPCFRCHSDHRGHDFNLLSPGIDLFDHAQTSFSLLWHQVGYDEQPMACSACHAESDFSVDLARCDACHADHDAGFMQQHRLDFGLGCLDCHDGKNRLADFDHAQTQFPLAGQHAGRPCAQCHTPAQSPGERTGLERFKNAPLECQGCHAEPPAHLGLFGSACQDCHTDEGWLPAIWKGEPFDHAVDAAFSLARHQLDYQGQPLTCAGCHAAQVEADVLPTCIRCHADGAEGAAFMQQHQETFGPDCLACHDGVDRMGDFDHNRVFVLDGAHGELDCQECHAGQRFRGTPGECIGCHAEPEIHAGVFGERCQDCHATQAWSPAQLTNHTFPLDHGEQGLVACETCHPSRYVEYTCYGCHEHEPIDIQEEHLEENISLAELAECARCHPNGTEAEGSND